VATASLIVWAITQWPTVRILLWPREDVQVVAANPLEGAVIVNRGDYEVFVAHIWLYMTGRTGDWIGQQFFVHASVAPGKFLQVAPPRKDDFGLGFWVRNIKDAKIWEKFVDQAVNDKQCFQILLFALDDPFLRAILESAPTINRLAAGGYVEYRTLTAPTDTRTLVQATGVIRVRSTPDCLKKVTAVGGL